MDDKKRINELEQRSIEITISEQQKEKNYVNKISRASRTYDIILHLCHYCP